MLMGHSDFITVQISNENTQVQIHQPKITGDLVISSAHSRLLTQRGWKGSRKNIPAAYLTGYYAGKKAIGKGTSSAIMYSGTKIYSAYGRGTEGCYRCRTSSTSRRRIISYRI